MRGWMDGNALSLNDILSLVLNFCSPSLFYNSYVCAGKKNTN